MDNKLEMRKRIHTTFMEKRATEIIDDVLNGIGAFNGFGVSATVLDNLIANGIIDKLESYVLIAEDYNNPNIFPDGYFGNELDAICNVVSSDYINLAKDTNDYGFITTK